MKPASPVFAAISRLILSRIGLLFSSSDARDAEILALRHQLLVLQRQINRPQLTGVDRTVLGALGSAMNRARRNTAFVIVKPETVLRWHHRRIARHWTQPPSKPPGRPPIDPQLRRLIIRIAAENPTWGYRRIHGELLRDGARQFTRPYDYVLAGSAITTTRIPPRSPQANAHAERWVRTLRHELLDRTIIWNERQLRQLLEEYIEHDNLHRPHRGINQRAPNDQDIVVPIRPGHPIQRHTTCNGLINQYRTAA